MSVRYLICLLIFGTVSVSKLDSQTTANRFHNLALEKELSQTDITALCIDKRGFIWVGTANRGLNRFDGTETKIFRHQQNDSLSLCDDHIVSILEDKNGFLWIGTQGGISHFNPANGRCQNYTSKNKKIKEHFKNFVFKDPKGNIWTGNNSGIERFDYKQNRFILLKDSNKFHASNRSAFDATGTLWCGGDKGLHSFNPKTKSWKHYSISSQSNSNFVDVKIDQHNNIWCLTWGEGLLRFDPKNQKFERFIWVKNPIFQGAKNIVHDVAETINEHGQRLFWISMENGLFKFQLSSNDFPSFEKKFTLYDKSSNVGLNVDGPRVLLTAGKTNLWCGSPGNGIFFYNSDQENFAEINNLKSNIITHVSFTKNRDILACGYGDPLVILDSNFKRKKIFSRFDKNMRPDDGRTSWSVEKDEVQNTIFVACFDGLVSLDSKYKIKKWYTFNPNSTEGLLDRKISNLFPIGNNRLLLGFWKKNLQIFDTKTGKNILVYNPKNTNGLICKRFRKTQDGKIWICCERHLIIYDTKTNKFEEITPNNEIIYNDVLMNSKGQLWVSTNNGLYLYTQKLDKIIEHYTYLNGLPGNEIQTSYFDKSGRIWLLTDAGACFFDPLIHKNYPLNEVKVLIHNRNPGEMEQMPDGRLLLIDGNNLVVFNPDKIKSPLPSKVYITGFKINQRDTFPDIPFENLKEIKLKPGENTLTLSYTAVDLSSTNKSNFEYKLIGLQNEWTQAGNNKIATFINIPAGNYEFVVRTANSGNLAEYEARLVLVITEHFWQHAWFKFLFILVLAIFGTGFSIYYYRSQLRLKEAESKRKEAITITRSQIAQDIHDDIGTDLSKISMGASVAAMMPDLEHGDLRQKLHSIGLEAQEVAQHLRDVVFITNPQFDGFNEVQAYYKDKSNAFLESVGLEFNFDFPKSNDNPMVSPEVKRQLYLLLRECLNNIAKHANASRVYLTFRIKETKDSDSKENKSTSGACYFLEIKDNGKGFTMTDNHSFGNGLNGILKRCEKIGARLSINSFLGEGTTIQVTGSL